MRFGAPHSTQTLQAAVDPGYHGINGSQVYPACLLRVSDDRCRHRQCRGTYQRTSISASQSGPRSCVPRAAEVPERVRPTWLPLLPDIQSATLLKAYIHDKHFKHFTHNWKFWNSQGGPHKYNTIHLRAQTISCHATFKSLCICCSNVSTDTSCCGGLEHLREPILPHQ
jgi:hypothetical protein